MPQTSLAAWLKPKDSVSKDKQRAETAKLEDHESSKARDARTADDATPAEAKEHARDSPNTALLGSSFISTSPGPVIKVQIPCSAKLVPITASILTDFRRLVAVLLPVPYRDKFFTDILDDPVTGSISLAALWRDDPAAQPKLVAGIRCRLLDKPMVPLEDAELGDKPCLYVAVIGTLAPFRKEGLASALLAQVTVAAAQEHGARSVVAHVWEGNEEAREWYVKLGFQQVSFDAVYYRRIKPPGAYVIIRRIQPSDLLRRVEPTQPS